MFRKYTLLFLFCTTLGLCIFSISSSHALPHCQPKGIEIPAPIESVYTRVENPSEPEDVAEDGGPSAPETRYSGGENVVAVPADGRLEPPTTPGPASPPSGVEVTPPDQDGRRSFSPGGGGGGGGGNAQAPETPPPGPPNTGGQCQEPTAAQIAAGSCSDNAHCANGPRKKCDNTGPGASCKCVCQAGVGSCALDTDCDVNRGYTCDLSLCSCECGADTDQCSSQPVGSVSGDTYCEQVYGDEKPICEDCNCVASGTETRGEASPINLSLKNITDVRAQFNSADDFAAEDQETSIEDLITTVVNSGFTASGNRRALASGWLYYPPNGYPFIGWLLNEARGELLGVTKRGMLLKYSRVAVSSSGIGSYRLDALVDRNRNATYYEYNSSGTALRSILTGLWKTTYQSVGMSGGGWRVSESFSFCEANDPSASCSTVSGLGITKEYRADGKLLRRLSPISYSPEAPAQLAEWAVDEEQEGVKVEEYRYDSQGRLVGLDVGVMGETLTRLYDIEYYQSGSNAGRVSRVLTEFVSQEWSYPAQGYTIIREGSRERHVWYDQFKRVTRIEHRLLHASDVASSRIRYSLSYATQDMCDQLVSSYVVSRGSQSANEIVTMSDWRGDWDVRRGHLISESDIGATGERIRTTYQRADNLEGGLTLSESTFIGSNTTPTSTTIFNYAWEYADSDTGSGDIRFRFKNVSVATITDDGLRAHSYLEFNDRGQVTRTTGADGLSTETEYNDQGFKTANYVGEGPRIDKAAATTTQATWSYSDSHPFRVREVVEYPGTPAETRTSYEYDTLNRVTGVSTNTGTALKLFRNFWGDVVSTWVKAADYDGKPFSWQGQKGPEWIKSYYDVQGPDGNLYRVAKELAAPWDKKRHVTVTATYSDHGRYGADRKTDWFGNVTRVVRNSVGSPYQVYYNDQLVSESRWTTLRQFQTRTAANDDNGTLSYVTENAHFDSLGNLTKETGEFNTETRYTYNTRGDVIETANYEGSQYKGGERYEYDGFSRLTAKFLKTLEGEHQLVRNEYNGQHQLIKIYDKNGTATELKYNGDGTVRRVSSELFWKEYEYHPRTNLIVSTVTDLGGDSTRRESLYDKGRVVSVSVDGRTESYEYDSFGAVARKTAADRARYRSIGNGSFRVSYREGLAGNTTTKRGIRVLPNKKLEEYVEYSDGRETRSVYGAQGLERGSSAFQSFELIKDELGVVDRSLFTSGQNTTEVNIRRDPYGRRTSLSLKVNGALYSDSSNSYTGTRFTGQSYTIGGQSGASTLGYDSLDRIERVTKTIGSETREERISYADDKPWQTKGYSINNIEYGFERDRYGRFVGMTLNKASEQGVMYDYKGLIPEGFWTKDGSYKTKLEYEGGLLKWVEYFFGGLPQKYLSLEHDELQRVVAAYENFSSTVGKVYKYDNSQPKREIKSKDVMSQAEVGVPYANVSGREEVVKSKESSRYLLGEHAKSGQTVEYEYDPQDKRVISVGGQTVGYSGNNISSFEGVSFEYDSFDRLISITKNGATTQLEYDLLDGRLKKVTEPNGDWSEHTWSGGTLVSTKYSDGGEAYYLQHPTVQNETLVWVKKAAGGSTKVYFVAWDGASNPRALYELQPDGSVVEKERYEYDLRGEQTISSPTGTLRQSSAYGFSQSLHGGLKISGHEQVVYFGTRYLHTGLSFLTIDKSERDPATTQNYPFDKINFADKSGQQTANLNQELIDFINGAPSTEEGTTHDAGVNGYLTDHMDQRMREHYGADSSEYKEFLARKAELELLGYERCMVCHGHFGMGYGYDLKQIAFADLSEAKACGKLMASAFLGGAVGVAGVGALSSSAALIGASGFTTTMDDGFAAGGKQVAGDVALDVAIGLLTRGLGAAVRRTFQSMDCPSGNVSSGIGNAADEAADTARTAKAPISLSPDTRVAPLSSDANAAQTTVCDSGHCIWKQNAKGEWYKTEETYLMGSGWSSVQTKLTAAIGLEYVQELVHIRIQGQNVPVLMEAGHAFNRGHRIGARGPHMPSRVTFIPAQARTDVTDTAIDRVARKFSVLKEKHRNPSIMLREKFKVGEIKDGKCVNLKQYEVHAYWDEAAKQIVIRNIIPDGW